MCSSSQTVRALTMLSSTTETKHQHLLTFRLHTNLNPFYTAKQENHKYLPLQVTTTIIIYFLEMQGLKKKKDPPTHTRTHTHICTLHPTPIPLPVKNYSVWYISLWMIGQRPALIAFFLSLLWCLDLFLKADAHSAFLWLMARWRCTSSGGARGDVINDTPPGSLRTGGGDNIVIWKQLLLTTWRPEGHKMAPNYPRPQLAQHGEREREWEKENGRYFNLWHTR